MLLTFLPIVVCSQSIYHFPFNTELEILMVGGGSFNVSKLKDPLAEGGFICFNEIRVGLKQVKVKDFEGEYQNGMKHGMFSYYLTSNKSRGRGLVSYKFLTVNYKNGQLHGPYFYFDTGGTPIEEGYYEMGEKQGYFIYHEQVGMGKEIYLYQSDSLIHYEKFSEDGFIILSD